MKLSRFVIGVFVFGFSVTTFAAVESIASVPKEYQGKWAADCRNDSTSYTITKNGSSDEQSDCKIKKLAHSAANNKMLNVSLECSSGEGGSSPSKEIWELTPDGKLSVIHIFTKTEQNKRILSACGTPHVAATPATNDKLLVSCNLAGNKTAQIFSPTKMSPYATLEYRYGIADKPEMTFIASASGDKMHHASEAWDSKTSVDSVWFTKGKFTYAIATCSGQCDETKSMALLVYEGKKRIAKKICTGSSINELDIGKVGALVEKSMPTGISVAEDMLGK